MRSAVRVRQTADWQRTYQSVPRGTKMQLKANGGRSVYGRGRGRCASDLDGQVSKKGFAALGPAAAQNSASPPTSPGSADDEPLYKYQSRWRRQAVNRS